MRKLLGGDAGVEHFLEGAAFLKRRDVRALQVLYDGENIALAIGDVDQVGLDRVEPGQQVRAPAPLAGDDHGSRLVWQGAHGDRLDQAVFLDRRASSASASGSKRLRGWSGFGMTEAIGRLAMIGFPDFRHVQVEGGLEPLGDHAAVAPVSAVKRRLLPTEQDRLGTDG